MSDTEPDVPPKKKQRLDDKADGDNDLNPARPEVVEDIDFSEDVTESENIQFSMSDSKYCDLVSAEEIEKLKEFQVLDEVKSDDEDSDEHSDSSDGKSEGIPEEEIEKMLDEDLPEGFKGAAKPKEKPYHKRQKTILEEKGINYFEVLPLDWITVRHVSGMPIYLHRGTRVVTLSKPYVLGQGNTRRHDIPISAIPCLNYRKALEEEAKQQEIDRKITEQIKTGSWKNADNSFKDTIDKSTNLENSVKDNDEVSKDGDNIDEKIKKNANLESSLKDSGKVSKDGDKIGEKIKKNANLESSLKDGDNIGEKINETANLESSLEYSDKVSKDGNNKHENIIVSVFNNLEEESKQQLNEQHIEESINDSVKKSETKCPFLHYSKKETPVTVNGDAKSEESLGISKENAESEDFTPRPVVLPGGIALLPPRVETVNTSWKNQHLTPEQFTDYCKALFKFKTVNIMHFQRWADRRKYTKARKTLQYPTLPEGTKLITIPAQQQPDNGGESGGVGGRNKRDWVMNMNGRSYLSVFHEYVRRALQKQPVYEFKQLENASTPYQATVHIGGMQYGSGRGTSKRLAKAAAARASIQILIPGLQALPDPTQLEPDFSFFDYVGIDDPRIMEFCAASCEPSPHAILRTCLLRNFGAGDRHIHTEMKKLEFQNIELTMKVGKHSATVVCKNKKAAKQRASQAILQALHPHVQSWGSLLRLYGSRSVKSCKEKKLEEQQITLLQDKARHNAPNHAVLEKLRQEMMRLRERDAAVLPIGTLLLKDHLPTHSGSNLNNVDL